jgi:lysozyme family protein
MNITLFARKTIHHYYIVEGGNVVVNDPDDLGGLTGPGGITSVVLEENKKLWLKHNFSGDISKVPYSLTEEIYYLRFWKEMGLDELEVISPELCNAIFGWGINSGKEAPVTVLQQFINCMNKKATLYPNMFVDGDYGPTTRLRIVDYLTHFKSKDGINKLIEIILSCQTAHYLSITVARKDETNEKYLNGWINRVMGKRARIFKAE